MLIALLASVSGAGGDQGISGSAVARHDGVSPSRARKDVDDPNLHLSAVTIGEIQAGIEVTRAQDPTKAAELEAWADQLADSHNVLAMDSACFR